MPELFAALEAKSGTHGYPISRTVQLSMGAVTDKRCSFLSHMCGVALLPLQSLATGMQENYAMLKKALHEKFIPKEQVKLLKAEFHARHHDWDQKLPIFQFIVNTCQLSLSRG